MSHGCHTCHCPNGCYCLELRQFREAEAALGPEIAGLMVESQRVDDEIRQIEKERARLEAQIDAKRRAFAPKDERLRALIKEKSVEADTYILASVKLLRIARS